ncbi:Homeobox protein cut-like [Caenorhabditis elegans]|uniref:Homeobox protein cut-like n=1 Tax=Caenorhabditis elegans TaxID=6239 RepID=A7DTF5_CAEEL|nr:Homeobox protein cut-like [Caenorhabditis elegans]CAO82074.1 Homeobox protein cut-like [Caenorhabditis elegans]|eukprot:NP_001122735.1 Uncharacterized protein CELE_Y56A3A.7 [Caenorhabditis elegans]
MSSVELPQVMDDNLISRRKKIMQSIEDIRGKKAEIAQALRELGVGKPQENESVKEDMKLLLAAFDSISAQEAQYMDILKTIVGIHEQATLDIAKDFEKKIEDDAQKLKEQKEKQEEDATEEDENAEKTPEEQANSEVIAELQEALLELKQVSEAAVAASELNEKLVERLQLTKRKKSAMMEVRAKKAKDLDDVATKVRAEVMERINKMAALKKTTTKQEKELKELQKQCLQLGLQLGTDENREIDPAAEEALLDDNQRVPVIVETQEKPDLNDEEKEKRREEIRENIKKEMEKKEQVNTLIREKLASMNARRKRLQEIRKMLEKQEHEKEKLDAAISNSAVAVQNDGEGIALTPETPRPSQEDEAEAPAAAETTVVSAPVAASEDIDEEEDGEVTEKSLDDILENARANLSNLTAMRERLEHIKETGGADLNEDDLTLLERLDNVALEEDEKLKLPPAAAPSLNEDSVDDEDEESDIESAVRATFHHVIQQPKPLELDDRQKEILNQARRAAIEDLIREIDKKLPTSPRADDSPTGSLSISLLSLEAGELREMAGYLLRLAELREQTPTP